MITVTVHGPRVTLTRDGGASLTCTRDELAQALAALGLGGALYTAGYAAGHSDGLTDGERRAEARAALAARRRPALDAAARLN